MSGICGIYRFDGQRASSELLEVLAAALAAPFGCQSSQLVDGSFGVAQVGHDSIYDHEDTIVACDGRIDGPVAAGIRGDAGSAPDAVARAHAKWGRAAPEHLMGDYAFARFDKRAKTLTLTVDPFATRPLYVYRTDAAAYFASSPDVLRRVPGIDLSPDLYRVADYLVGTLEWFEPRRTFFAAVKRVPAAHEVVFDGKGNATSRRWWSAAPREPHRFQSSAEMGESLRAVLGPAVADRLRGSRDTGILLSGGVDSGLLFGLARAHAKLPSTYSAVEADESSCPDAPFIRQMLAGYEGRSYVLSPRETAAWGAPLDTLLRTADMPFAFKQASFRPSLIARAGEDGVGTLLTGVFGDDLFSLPACGAWPLVRSGRLGSARSVLRTYAQYRKMGIARAMWHQVVRPSIPTPIRRLLRRARPIRSSAFGSLIHPSLAEQAHVRARLANAMRSQMFRGARTERAHMFNAAEISCATERYAQMSRPFGVVVTHPYLDLRVVDWALRLPTQAAALLDHPKAAVAAASVGLVPSEVRTRTPVPNPNLWPALLGAREAWIRRMLDAGLPTGWIRDRPAKAEMAGNDWVIAALAIWHSKGRG